jgi:alkyl hydroperoxide reductase subunit AhpC
MYKNILMLLLMSAAVFGQAVGTKAPDFTYDTVDYGTISLSDYSGKIVYLFFFGWN